MLLDIFGHNPFSLIMSIKVSSRDVDLVKKLCSFSTDQMYETMRDTYLLGLLQPCLLNGQYMGHSLLWDIFTE